MAHIERNIYKEHRFRIKNAVCFIDNKPPKLDPYYFYNPRRLGIDANRMKEIDKENLNLLKKLNAIVRLGGRVDCWNEIKSYKSIDFKKEVTRQKLILEDNKKFLIKLLNAPTRYPMKEFIEDWKNMYLQRCTNLGKSMPLIFLSKGQTRSDNNMVLDLSVIKELNSSIRKKCFFDIEIQEAKHSLGRIIIELFNDIVPRTCANFEAFCRGYKGLSYKNTPFHRIVMGYWLQGGDVTNLNGSGGTSIYGDSFENENFKLSHSSCGVLSMCNTNNTNDSKFNIIFKRLKSVNGKRVVFGRIISGIGNFAKVEEFGTKSGKPLKAIIISNCGVLEK